MSATNKFGVPSRTYRLMLADGTSKKVDVGDESDWGNIQPCIPGDCPDWDYSVGYGNDSDGHVKISSVHDVETGKVWPGTVSVRRWYDQCVACYAENYSS